MKKERANHGESERFVKVTYSSDHFSNNCAPKKIQCTSSTSKNRQYKMEERRRDGSVKGRYGFYDAKGKLKVVSYIAGPTGDYEERHHETITYKPDI
ncbi:uncharacterized protein LOC105831317 isoform X2 [Monomorium pharaonis]|uniref:uncharacterized protein LOC105831317 isoform X2 n=1 Tax=Monomorium pharaonis TaxID=307658 RepID=UPI0017478C67|nr:uncharacterized protein LOC105831317 isoform X2 [Monomorium pharaonis]